MLYAIFLPQEVLTYVIHLVDNHSITYVETGDLIWTPCLVSHELGRLQANSSHDPSWCKSDNVASNVHIGPLFLYRFALFLIYGLLSQPQIIPNDAYKLKSAFSKTSLLEERSDSNPFSLPSFILCRRLDLVAKALAQSKLGSYDYVSRWGAWALSLPHIPGGWRGPANHSSNFVPWNSWRITAYVAITVLICLFCQ